jgi:hypothetical protein
LIFLLHDSFHLLNSVPFFPFFFFFFDPVPFFSPFSQTLPLPSLPFPLYQLLPADETLGNVAEHEEAEMTDFDPSRHQSGGSRGSSNNYEEDEGGEEPRVQCAHQ